LLGGVIGLAIAFPISLIIDGVCYAHGNAFVGGIFRNFISLFFGVLSGFFPAFNAAKMDRSIP